MPQPQVAIQVPEKRINNFNEVSLGFSKKVAVEEACRCQQCQEPTCIQGCSLGVVIPEFIKFIKENNLNEAYKLISQENPFPSVCGRLCSAECEHSCTLNKHDAPIAIRALERYVSDFGRSRQSKRDQKKMNKKVAVIGAGPAGLSAAEQLAKLGYNVTVFESFDKPGGVLRYGVPEFRLPKKILDGDINEIKQQGVDILTNVLISQTLTIDELQKKGFSAILISTGAAVPRFLDIPGSNAGGVYYGEEFLMRVNLMKTGIFSTYIPNFVLGSKIVVVGAGNTALDCARSAVRMGRDVTLLFKKPEEEMRASLSEKEFAKEEGIHFEALSRPTEIIVGPDNFISAVKCVRIDRSHLNNKGRWIMADVPGSEFTLEADTMIVAIGHRPNPLISRLTKGLHVSEDGSVEVDETGMTSMEGVFAAGNVVSNARPLIEAIAAGKNVAKEIDRYLKG